jgi:hypothetical protein
MDEADSRVIDADHYRRSHEVAAALAAIPEHACPAAKVVAEFDPGVGSRVTTRRRNRRGRPFSRTRAVTDIAVEALPTQSTGSIQSVEESDGHMVDRTSAAKTAQLTPESRVG